MNITVKNDSLVIFAGAMGTGKSTLARKLFAPHHIVETDFIRQQLTGDFQNQSLNDAVFEILYATIDVRLKSNLLTVVDSTGSRSLIEFAARMQELYKMDVVVIVMPELSQDQLTQERMQHRMKSLNIYNHQIQRVKNTKFPKSFRVHYVTDPNNVQLIVQSDVVSYDLPSGQTYVVVPDLHGEISILNRIIDANPNHHFVFLGDIVDRGESSYETFRTVNRLIQTGRGYGVISNHDNKFYRWCKKWVADNFTRHADINPYGMSIAHGLNKTLNELHDMPIEDAIRYAKDFIAYYESLSPYLRLEKQGTTHYFSHIGMTYNVVNGNKLTNDDLNSLIYREVDEELLRQMFKGRGPSVHHVGHVYRSDTIVTKHVSDNLIIMYHDIGFGKRQLTKEDTFEVFCI